MKYLAISLAQIILHKTQFNLYFTPGILMGRKGT